MKRERKKGKEKMDESETERTNPGHDVALTPM